MRLSIIVPFHKGIHFLEDCLESIRDQGLSDFETILVLDHVKEDISGLVSEYKDLNLKPITLNEARLKDRRYGKAKAEEQFKGYSGVAAARNAGLDAAAGKYVYFLDSDDYIMNGTLELLLQEAEEQDADFTYGRKKSTWFRRIVYLSSLAEKEQEEQDQEQAENGDDHGEQDELDIMDTFQEEDAPKLTRRQRKILKVQAKLAAAAQEEVDEEALAKIAEAYHSLLVTRKGLHNVSVLGILFRRSFLQDRGIRFNEDYIFFSDSTFVIQALQSVKRCSHLPEAVYIKRKHNDPIHFPAICQSKTEDKFEEYIQAYRQARSCTGENSVLRGYLESKLIAYYSGTYAPRLRRSEKDVWRTERFQVMRSAMEEVDPDKIKGLRGYKKRIVKALLKNNVRKATVIVSAHLGKKKFRKIKKNKRVFAYYLYHKFFTKMAVKENWVICESFFGKSYSDSPKYIYEYLCKNYPGKYRFIWVVNHRTEIPYRHTRVKRFSIRYCYYLARCKYNVFNVRQPEWMRKREGNVFLETWHGTPLKKLVFDQEEVMGASPLYKAQFYKQSRVWDYLVAANKFSSEAFRSAFLFDKEMLEFGYPRNDILHSPHRDEIASKIRRKLKIPENKKTILYAPTWRDDEYYGRGEYKFALKLDLHLLKKELGKDYVVLLRTHYFIADSLDVTGLEDFAYNVSQYDDISELYLISDLLITDYSSVFFDYANLKRPILFYTYDLDKYRDMLRGFYMDIETEVPGPLLFTNEEVVDAIRDIEDITEQYREKYEDFYERFCSLEDGHAAENIAKRVFNLN
ncbi:bifunctional glycosyltransferase/CDP-glycerol:glycerophosphate glycerophosphotransferase [Anaerotaenia torta]|uniref:bifunctional glycosyltransferase/CDP-glycerol:glycerophosphate glycerophosphotransferase n=1 Tax=Anaerotaenia torta TaxID=433293 RepID=UPI003D201953